MAFDVKAAKADGYTDEEIQQYLATKDQPLPSEQPRDRTEEAVGTWTSAIPDAVKYGLEGAGLYAGGKAIANAIGNRGAPMTPPAPPAAPTTFTGGAAPAWDSALSKPYTPPAPSVPPAPPSNANYMQRMTQLADRYLPAAKQAASTVGRAVAPVARVLGSAPVMGAQLALTPSTTNANEMQELRRRQAMPPTFNMPQQ